MIAIAQSLMVFFAAFARLRFAFYTFVALIPFMPRYLSIGLGSEGGALSARRISLIFLIVVFLLWLIYDNRKIDRLVQQISLTPSFFVIAILLYVVKFLATVLFSGVNATLFYVIDDFMYALPVMLLVMMTVSDADALKRVLQLIVLGLLVSELISIIEYIRQAPLLTGIVDIQVEVNERLIEGRFRDERYRASALFDNPLLLSEYVCFAWPFSFYFMRHAHSPFLRLLSKVSLILAPITLYFVNSRSGWLIFALGILALLSLGILKRGDRAMKILFSAMALLGMTLVALLIIIVFTSPEIFFSASEEGGVSALERISQYYVVAQAFLQKPLFGYGMQQNFAGNLDFLNRLDNYWLRLVLEGGSFAVAAFFMMIVIAVRSAFRWLKEAEGREEERLASVVAVSLISFSLYKLFLSMPWNNIYLFILAGILIARKSVEQTQSSSEAI